MTKRRAGADVLAWAARRENERRGLPRKTVTEELNAILRSRLSCRRAVAQEAHRRGLDAGLRARLRPSGAEARIRIEAAASAEGRDPTHECEVPARWRPLFKRIFVKAALYAAHTDRDVTVTAVRG